MFEISECPDPYENCKLKKQIFIETMMMQVGVAYWVIPRVHMFMHFF